MAVNVVDRNSDDFEPFEKIISQADSRTPPRVQGRRKKQAELSPIGDDMNGEMSMDLDMDSSAFHLDSLDLSSNIH
jgi:centromere protein C